jgi:hypothetical protein
MPQLWRFGMTGRHAEPALHLCCDGTDVCSGGCHGLECSATLTADALVKREREDCDNLWGGH